jgi:hypothetical protein
MAGNRANGLIVEDLDTGKRKFVSMRKHQFSPLETIAVFTITDSVPLLDVFQKMLAMKAEMPPVSHKSNTDTLRDYFESVVPEHDPTRVYPKDIQKIIKWFHFLDDRNLLQQSSDEEE